MKRGPSKAVLQANQAQLARIKSYEAIVLQGTLLGRASLFSGLGSQYGGDRNVYEALGYPTVITFDDYAKRYFRQDIAKAIINRPADATWRGPVTILEKDDNKKTGLEKAWDDLNRRLLLKSTFVRLDKLACLGRYGALLLGFDDAATNENLKQPVRPGKRVLSYVRPLSEEGAKIASYEQNASNPRYGLPLLYNVNVAAPNRSTTQSIQVHYTRIIHVPGEILDSEIEGAPVLEAVYNRLMDLEKLVGGSGEMFWRGARPGYHGKVSEGFQLTDEGKLALQAQLDEYEHNLRRFLINEGVDLEAFEMQVAEPGSHVTVQLQMICAVTGIPLRILIGSERGELASSQDRMNWLELIQERRANYAEGQIVRPFIERCQQYGVLPESKPDYKVVWTNIFAPSEKEQAQIGQQRAAALMAYMNNPLATEVIPPELFIELMLGLDRDGIEHAKRLYEEAKGRSVDDEQNLLNNPDVADATAAGGGNGNHPRAQQRTPAMTVHEE